MGDSQKNPTFVDFECSRTHTGLNQCMGVIIEAVSIIADQSSSVSVVAIYDSEPPTGGHDLCIGERKTGHEGREADIPGAIAIGADTRSTR